MSSAATAGTTCTCTVPATRPSRGTTSVPTSTGSFALYDTQHPIGVLVERARTILIGGTAPGAGNVISGNADYGVYVYDAERPTISSRGT